MGLTGNDLKNIGFAEGKAIGLALQVIEKEFTTLDSKEKLLLLKRLLQEPSIFLNDALLSPLAIELLKPEDDTIALNAAAKPYQIYGAEAIEEGALQQMETAMKLPVTVAGALMPDAHQGYGLPIGGVLATKNSVIPYGVGVDIGCRMCMTIYDLPVTALSEKKDQLKKVLVENTKFGFTTFKNPKDHPVLEDPA